MVTKGGFAGGEFGGGGGGGDGFGFESGKSIENPLAVVVLRDVFVYIYTAKTPGEGITRRHGVIKRLYILAS
tara:strand:- start:376 stop:591 length:216 start_codon:yes stop_codon:yes gene_type:complete